MAKHPGIVYLRTIREKTKVIYKNNEKFKIGGLKVLKKSKKDSALVIATGITVHEALKAYETLNKKNKNIRIIDLYSLKPLDEKAILSHVSYYEAYAYARWKGMRLPTEFEWEAASDVFSWGKRWEITRSAYLEYPGFKISEGAVGEYNGKFMVNQMVFRGASNATSPNHSRKTYRNFFHPWLQWQYSGIRLVKNNV